MPYARTRSAKSRKSQDYLDKKPADRKISDDDCLFERADSSADARSNSHHVNDENMNLASNQQETKKKRVTKITKDKVNFLSQTASKTMKFEEGQLSKITALNNVLKKEEEHEKFESIINSSGLRGLIMKPVLAK